MHHMHASPLSAPWRGARCSRQSSSMSAFTTPRHRTRQGISYDSQERDVENSGVPANVGLVPACACRLLRRSTEALEAGLPRSCTGSDGRRIEGMVPLLLLELMSLGCAVEKKEPLASLLVGPVPPVPKPTLMLPWLAWSLEGLPTRPSFAAAPTREMTDRPEALGVLGARLLWELERDRLRASALSPPAGSQTHL
jgi:hypothetical protein